MNKNCDAGPNASMAAYISAVIFPATLLIGDETLDPEAQHHLRSGWFAEEVLVVAERSADPDQLPTSPSPQPPE